ncbi:MAG TPA: F0F1 ATP synthase subunit epsilon [Kiloniellales bacterium]|jgi:F-type H+-transporting ATPase subunit epsilon|nr:F0F1 ATP synthase subunit epsilon [Kiloniellales bacterium]
MAEKVEFELVSPEKLLLSQPVDMVVVPGGDGDFGVLPRHAPMISTVRPGVISVYETRQAVSQRLFVAGGFAEVTPERCTVLAVEAEPLEEIDRSATEQELRDAREDVADAKDEHEKAAAIKRVTVLEAKLDALRFAL